MAFTDLAEHLEELFGDVRTEEQHVQARDSARGERGKKSRSEKRRLEHRRRINRAMERFLSQLADGTRPTTCRGPYCCNLLLPQRGAIKEFCGDGCKKMKAKVMRRLNG